MFRVANVGHVQSRHDSRRQVETQLLATQLGKLRALRHDEKRLRAKVALLQKQAINQGPLHREVGLALTLDQEVAALEQLRQQLLTREQEIEAEPDLPGEESRELKARRLEAGLSDLKARRNEVRWQQSNVNFLEEKLASQGTDARLDVVNELKLSREELTEVESRLTALHERLQLEWQLTPAELPDTDEMTDAEIEAFALQVVIRRETASREMFTQRMTEGARAMDALVTEVLEEFRATAYPSCGPCRLRYSQAVGLSLERVDSESYIGVADLISQPRWEARTEISWGLQERGSFAAVDIVLRFDAEGNPTGFSCRRQGHDPAKVSTESARLDRDSLREALQSLHPTPEPWWKFWK